MGYIGTAPVKGDYRKLDNVASGFNGVDTAFTLQVGTVNVTPPKETTVIISVGGILQEPVVAYTISGSTITFTSAPAAGAGFFGMLMGESYSVGLPDIADGTITEAKMAANSVNSNQYVDGSIDNEHIANGTIAMSKTALTAGTGLTLTTNDLSVDAAQTGITSLVVGHTAQVAADVTAEFQVLGTGTADTSGQFGIWSADATPFRMDFVKSRNATIGSNTIVQDNDVVVRFQALPDDGVDYATSAALYQMEVDDASPAAGDIGMAHVWKQMPGAGGALTETMRLNAAGDLAIASGAKFYLDGVVASGDTYIYEESADDLHVVVGGVAMVQIDQDLDAIGFGASPDTVAYIDINPTRSGTNPMGLLVQGTYTDTSGGGAMKLAQFGASGSSITTNYTGTVEVARISTVEIFEPNITLGTSDTATIASTLYVANAPTEGTTNAAIYVASGDINLSTMIFRDGGDATIPTDGTRIWGDNSGTMHLSALGSVLVDLDTNNNGTTSSFAVRANATTTTAFKVYESGLSMIGDDSNVNMTVGLTINQGANDDAILALKSSDIAHGMTSVSGPSETDDYLIVRKNHGTIGGVDFRAYAEDAALNTALNFQSYGGTATTAKTTSGIGLINMQAFEHNGSNGLADITADGNVFSIRARVGGSLVTRFLVDEDGDTFISGNYSFLGDDDTYMASGTANQLDWYVGGANDMRLTSAGHLHVESDVYAYSSSIASDRKLKTNIVEIPKALDKVKALQGVTFDYKDKERGSSVGLIAQDVQEIYPELVKLIPALNEGDESYQSLNYSGIIGLLVEAVKELSDKVGD
jgi:hypothetical protein